MSERGNAHFYRNWATERMSEMNAVLASLEAKARTVRADSRVHGDQLLADMKNRRDQFKVAAKQHTEAEGAAWERAHAELESLWHAFEAEVKTYFQTVSKDADHHHVTFREVAGALMAAWREAAGKVQDSASKLTGAGRAEIDGAVKQMKSDADATEARLQKLNYAGRDSWSALSAALAEARKAFDRANHQASRAMHRAMK